MKVVKKSLQKNENSAINDVSRLVNDTVWISM